MPKHAYDELSRPSVPHLKKRVDAMVQSGNMKSMSFQTGSREAKLFDEMTKNLDRGIKVIGKGEASALALAIVNGGIVASNNYCDIHYYVKKYSVQTITTGEILEEALNQRLITEGEGNQIWLEMLKKRRKLPANTFSGYLQKDLLNS